MNDVGETFRAANENEVCSIFAIDSELQQNFCVAFIVVTQFLQNGNSLF